MQQLILLIALAIAPVLTGCAAPFVGAAGALVATEVLENETHIAHFNLEADDLWHSAKRTASHASLEPIVVDEDLRTIEAKLDGAVVYIGVETFDIRKSVLRVAARKYGMVNGEIANVMLTKIVDDLESEPENL